MYDSLESLFQFVLQIFQCFKASRCFSSETFYTLQKLLEIFWYHIRIQFSGIFINRSYAIHIIWYLFYWIILRFFSPWFFFLFQDISIIEYFASLQKLDTYTLWNGSVTTEILLIYATFYSCLLYLIFYVTYIMDVHFHKIS